jgi:hypothetical protein
LFYLLTIQQLMHKSL